MSARRKVADAAVAAWMAAFRRGELAHCAALGRQFVAEAQTDARAWHLLGLATTFGGDPRGGAEQLRRAARLGRDDASVWDALGVALQRGGEHAAAAEAFRTSLRLAPQAASVWSNAAANAFAAGDAAEALRLAGRAVELQPALAEGHLACGNALKELGRDDEAIAAFGAALRLRPGFAEALLGLGAALQQRGRLREAVEATLAAAQRAPALVQAQVNLSSMYCALGDNQRAAEHARRAIDADPDAAQAWSNLLYALTHDESVPVQAAFDAHLAFGRRFEAGRPPARHGNTRDPARRLRIGFVSADLRDHPVAHFIEPVLRSIDRAAFATVAYMAHAGEDAVSARLRACMDGWHNVAGLDDERLCARIADDGIDILFDLSGHTAGNRLTAFARKPAPLQATWIGYPGSTGLAAMDYVICDRFNAPHGLYERYFTERFARLPSAGAFTPPAEAPPVGPLPALAAGHLSFASFNRPNKLGDGVVAAWARVLHACPGSRLLLGNVGDEGLAAALRERFAGHGIAGERLDFRPRLALQAYLALHREVDVILDTWPYTGGTTTNLALWMGVPVLTLRGPSRAHCQSGAALERTGLAEWVADDVDDFVARGRRLAQDLDALAALRAGLRERWQAAPLRRADTVTRGLEAALRTMWRRWCEGLPPAHFEVPMDEIAEGGGRG